MLDADVADTEMADEPLGLQLRHFFEPIGDALVRRACDSYSQVHEIETVQSQGGEIGLDRRPELLP